MTREEVLDVKSAGDSLEIRWEGDRWMKATVEWVGEKGADVIPRREDGTSPGVHYVLFSDMRAAV